VAEERRTGKHRSPVWGIFLIFLGVIFLLQTFGVWPWQLWSTLWKFWPVLLIIVGTSVLLRHRHPWITGAITIVLLLASLLIAIVMSGPPVSG